MLLDVLHHLAVVLLQALERRGGDRVVHDRVAHALELDEVRLDFQLGRQRPELGQRDRRRHRDRQNALSSVLPSQTRESATAAVAAGP